MPRAGIIVPKDSVQKLLSPLASVSPRESSQAHRNNEMYANRQPDSNETQWTFHHADTTHTATKCLIAPSEFKDVEPSVSRDVPSTKTSPPVRTSEPGALIGQSKGPPDARSSKRSTAHTKTVPYNREAPLSSEKERFVAAMEQGFTKKSLESKTMGIARSLTAPVKISIDTVDTQDRLRRQLSFKADLEAQIAERRQAKLLEAQREREYELQQEARVALERAQLQKDFDAEQRSRLAKVSKANETSQVGSPLEERQQQPPRAAASPSQKGRRTHTANKERPTTSTSNARKKGAPEATEGPSCPSLPPQAKTPPAISWSPSPATKPAEELAVAPRSPSSDTPTVAGGVIKGGEATVDVLKRVLEMHMAELRRLQDTSVQSEKRSAEVLSSVLDLLRQRNQADALHTTLPTLPLAPLQLPMMVLAEQSQANLLGSAPGVFLNVPGVPETKLTPHSIPIVYTSENLRLEDSRPSTRQVTQGRSLLPIATKDNSQHRVSNSPQTALAKKRGNLAKINMDTSIADSKRNDLWLHKLARAQHDPRKPDAFPIFEHRGEKLSLWKRAGRHLKTLAVTKRPGETEAAWVSGEPSTTL